MKKFPKTKPYNHYLQVLNMQSAFPQFKSIKTKEGFDFIGILKPRDIEYQIKIMYRKRKDPKVIILSPEILDNKHRYSDGSLCIYKQSEFNWREDKLISKYIVPLIASWLYFHEVYLLTGKWYGQEAQHESGETKRIVDLKI